MLQCAVAAGARAVRARGLLWWLLCAVAERYAMKEEIKTKWKRWEKHRRRKRVRMYKIVPFLPTVWEPLHVTWASSSYWGSPKLLGCLHNPCIGWFAALKYVLSLYTNIKIWSQALLKMFVYQLCNGKPNIFDKTCNFFFKKAWLVVSKC